MLLTHGSTNSSSKSAGGRAVRELLYSSPSYRKQRYLPSSSVGADGGDIALAYHTMLHQNTPGDLYSSDCCASQTDLSNCEDRSGQAESTGRSAAEERVSPAPRRFRSAFASPRPAGTGRCWSRLQQDLPGVGCAGAVTVLTEEGGTALAAEPAAASNRTKDPGWKLPYLPVGSIASGGLLPFPITQIDSPRSQTVFAPISSPRRSILSPASHGCQ